MKYEEAFEKLQELENSFSVPKYQLENGEQLIHYTSPQALKSILDNQELWLTRADFFLDKSENKYAFSVLADVLQIVSLDEDFRNEILAFCDAFLYPQKASGEFRSLVELEPKYYVGSFSTKKDDLFMWNSYTKTADRSGYAIRFCDSFFRGGYDAGIEFRLFGKVVYERKKQNEIFAEMLNKFNDWYVKNSKFGFEADWHIKSSFAIAFYYQSIFIKKSCFSAENEYRMVFEPSELCKHPKCPYPLSKDEEDPYLSYPYKIKHYERNGIMVPYFGIKLDLNAIESIMPSPYMNYGMAEKGLKSVFSTKSMGAWIEKSEIPF